METNEKGPRTLIACVGNMLLMDEGLGPYMARVLTDRDVAIQHFDEEHADKLTSMFRLDEVNAVEDGRYPVLDAGTIGMGLLPWIRDYDRIIVIDIIDTKSPDIPAGSVFVLTPAQMAESVVLHSLHDLKLADVVNNCALAGYEADVTCICVQAKDYDPPDFVIDLTPEVKAAIPRVVGALMEQLGE